ncbi:MAG: elongation factor G, partial [Armatimonadetes bacterium]|nr:elongation factor G [Armatimonadota bacterium]
VVYLDETGNSFREEEIPDDLRALAAEYREKMMEACADVDDSIMERFLEGKEIGEEEVRAALRQGTLTNKIVPIICGSSFKNRGVQALMDAIVYYLPSPVDVGGARGTNPDTGKQEERPPDDDAGLCGLAFKIVTDPYVGRLTYVRIYSGTLKKGTRCLVAYRDSQTNAFVTRKERVGRILLMHANNREDVDEVYAGDIVGVIGLSDVTTGHTVCSLDAPIVLEAIEFPEPVISIAIEPRSKADQEKLAQSLQRLSQEDPTFRVITDEETGQTIISGMGELHLEIIVDRLGREFGVKANQGRPMVAYKETVRTRTKAEGRHIRQTGGAGQYGHVVIEMEPLPPGSGLEVEDKIVGGSIPKEFIRSVKTGIRQAMESGVLAGYPVVDVKVTLVDGSFHEVDSSENAFKQAAVLAFRDAMQRAHPALKEPVMHVEITTPEQYLGDVIGDIQARRGRIEGTEPALGGVQIVKSLVPLAEMFGYVTSLRSLSQGRATPNVTPSHYEDVPQGVADEIIAKAHGGSRV